MLVALIPVQCVVMRQIQSDSTVAGPHVRHFTRVVGARDQMDTAAEYEHSHKAEGHHDRMSNRRLHGRVAEEKDHY